MTDLNSGAAIIPAATTPPPAGSPPAGASFIETIPEGYRDKEWAKQNTKDADTFFKFVDNLNSTVGKKGVIIPGENALPEEINGFHKSMGRPDKPEEYVFGNIEEFKDAKRDEGKDLIVKKLFHEAGVPKDMAVKVQQGFEKFIFGEQQKVAEANKKIDEDFDKNVTKVFGDKKDAVLGGVKKLLAENISPEVRVKLEQLDNNALVVLAAAIDGIAKKYIGEDPYTGGAGHISTGAESYEQLSAKQRELMGKPGFSDFRHAEHQKLMTENNEIIKKMREIRK